MPEAGALNGMTNLAASPHIALNGNYSMTMKVPLFSNYSGVIDFPLGIKGFTS